MPIQPKGEQEEYGAQAEWMANELLAQLSDTPFDIVKARTSLAAYAEYLFLDEMGQPFQNTWFHKAVYDALLNHRYVLLLMFRGAAKSTSCSIVYPSWCLGNDPNLRIVIASDSREQSAQFLRANEQVMLSQKWEAIFGQKVPRTKGELTWNDYEKVLRRPNEFIKEASLLALGVHGAVRSRRADILIGDDLVSEQNSATPAQRAKLSHWFWSVFMPMRWSESKIVVVGSPLYNDDLYAELADKWSRMPEAKVLEIPALITDADGNEQSVWPERYPLEMLIEARTFDPKAFASQYMCRPMPDMGFDVDFDVTSVQEWSELPENAEWYAIVDPGGWGKQTFRTNHFAIGVGVLPRDENPMRLRLVAVQRGKGGLEVHSDAVIRMLQDYPAVGTVIVEANAAQALLVEYLAKELKKLPWSIRLKTVISKDPKDLRLALFARALADGKVLVPQRKDSIKGFWKELETFPAGGVDSLDAVSLLYQHTMRVLPIPALSVSEPIATQPSGSIPRRSLSVFHHGARPSLFQTRPGPAAGFVGGTGEKTS